MGTGDKMTKAGQEISAFWGEAVTGPTSMASEVGPEERSKGQVRMTLAG